MSWNAFLDGVVTRAAAVSGISSAVRAANADPTKIVKIPGQWPKALVHNLGGQTDDFNGKVQHRLFGITIVVFVPRATLGGEAEKRLATLCELMETAFVHTRDSNSIRLHAMTQDQVEVAGEAELYMSTMIFTYDSER